MCVWEGGCRVHLGGGRIFLAIYWEWGVSEINNPWSRGVIIFLRHNGGGGVKIQVFVKQKS